MTKLFLHIGPHKTGSTYIQKFFFVNRERLLNLGVNYPNVGFGGQYGQHETVEKIKQLEHNKLEAYLAQLLGSSTNFVSSENFDRLTLGDVNKLSKCLAKIDVKIIYYFRNYIALLPSWWQEEVKHGATISFHEFVLPHILRPFSSKIVNPAIVLDLYAHGFGKGNITVIDYDLARQNGSILRPIFEMLDLDLGVVDNEMVNSSLKGEIVEIIRALNVIANFKDQGNKHKIRSLFLRKMGADAIASEVEYLASEIRVHMKPLRFAGGFFEKSVNTAFRKKYESCFFRNLLGESPDRAVFVPSDAWMLKGDALMVCERIYQHIMTGDLSY